MLQQGLDGQDGSGALARSITTVTDVSTRAQADANYTGPREASGLGEHLSPSTKMSERDSLRSNLCMESSREGDTLG